MKKIILISVCSFFFSTLYSQIYINSISLDSIPSLVFVKICPGPSQNLLCTALVDYGQERERPIRNSKIITDKDGNTKYFNSNMAIMNFMFNNGFDIYRISDSTSCILYVKKGNFPVDKT